MFWVARRHEAVRLAARVLLSYLKEGVFALERTPSRSTYIGGYVYR